MKKYTWRNFISYMKDNPEGYWFKRKLYGWGWVPVKWQGWLVLVLGMLIFFAGVYIGDIDDSPGLALLGLLVAIALFIFFGYWKGEKPKWTWGRVKNENKG